MDQKNKKRIKFSIAGVLLGLVAIVLISVGLLYLKLHSLNKTMADFIAKPQIILAEPEELEPVVETPGDLDEDYVYDVETPGSEAIYKQVTIDEDVFNILMVGSDVRDNEEGNGRSDSMMLVSYNRKTHDIKITSFMRDTWVAIPNKGWNRINAAFAYGGIGLSVNTVNENFGLDIQNYAIVEFEGLKNIVDSLGGVEVNLTLQEIKMINAANPKNPLKLVEGKQLLNGDQALTHSRNRKTGDGDFGRTRRQRDVMLAILVKMKASLNPVKLASFVTETLKFVDTNISPNTVFTLGMEILGAGGYTVQQARVPFDNTWKYANKDGRSVVTIDLEKNKTLLHEFLYGEE